MLLSLRDRVKGSKWLGITIVVIIAIPFALVGIGSYLGGSGDNYAARVNDEEIDIRTYERNYYAQRYQLQQMFGGSIPEGFANASFLQEQAIETSVTQALLSQHTAEAGYAVGDAIIAAAIYSEPAFQIDGEFSKTQYERQLQSQGLGAQQFEDQLRRDLTVNHMREGVLVSTFQTSAERQRLQALRSQERTFLALNFEPSQLDQIYQPSQEEIASHFKENQQNYRHPEAVKLEYIELDQSLLKSKVEVDDELLQ